MKQKFIKLSEDSYIEIATRLYDGQTKTILALRGVRNNSSPALASAVVENSELQELIEALKTFSESN